ncbi:MAG TPA: hypothetical protein VLM80_07970 [Anaerolineales bacterium]|nr:hypothetical protein [Anaerolineales bacterium]
MLHAFIGYEAAPTLLMVIAYLSYALFFVGKFFVGARSSILAREDKPMWMNTCFCLRQGLVCRLE